MRGARRLGGPVNDAVNDANIRTGAAASAGSSPGRARSGARPERGALIEGVRAQIEAQLAGVAAMTAAARDEATASESRPENQYDTRALEASYLAAGQGQRLAELKELQLWAAQLTAEAPGEGAAAQGCFVALRLLGHARCVLLGRAGGLQVEVEGLRVEVVSERSPLGQALVGLVVGDEGELETPRGLSRLEVDAVW